MNSKEIFNLFKKHAETYSGESMGSFRSATIVSNKNFDAAKRYGDGFMESFEMIKHLLEESEQGSGLKKMYQSDCILETKHLEILGVKLRFIFRFSNMQDNPLDCRIDFIKDGDL